MRFSVDELMTVLLARAVPPGAAIQVGAGVPLSLAAACLAKRTTAPGAILFPFGISGVEARRPFRLTLRAVEAAGYHQGLPHEAMSVLARTQRRGAFEPLSPAQLDAEGDLNTVAIGPLDRPKVRLPGVAGTDVLGGMPGPLLLYTTRHSPRTLVPRVDSVMASGRGERSCLVTDLAVLRGCPGGGWRVDSLHPGVSWEQLREATGFPLERPAELRVTLQPSEEELTLLREEIDPHGLRRLEFLSARERAPELRRIMAEERAWLRGSRASC